MKYVLKTENLVKKYGKFKALDNVSLQIPKGAIYGLIGKNGSGKTTLIRIISGLQKPTSGTYSIYNTPYDSKNIYLEREKMSSIIEEPVMIRSMSAKENLIHEAKMFGLPNYDKINDLLKLVGLEKTLKKKTGNFSLGMKQRLGIAMSLLTNPDFLVLDEPINGLDPEGIIEIRELLLKLNQKKGITILISSHYLDELSKIATHYGFLNEGHLIKEISKEELKEKLRKCIILKVDNVKETIIYLEQSNLSYEIIENDTLYVYSDIGIQKLVLELEKRKCNVIEIHEKEESLENYYINLIGGNYD